MEAIEIINKLEIEFIELSHKKIQTPLMEKSQIQALIWNLLISEKWRKKISYDNYSEVFDILTKRLNKVNK